MHKGPKLSLVVKLPWAVRTYRRAAKDSRHGAGSLKLLEGSARKLVTWLLLRVVNLLDDVLVELNVVISTFLMRG